MDTVNVKRSTSTQYTYKAPLPVNSVLNDYLVEKKRWPFKTSGKLKQGDSEAVKSTSMNGLHKEPPLRKLVD